MRSVCHFRHIPNSRMLKAEKIISYMTPELGVNFEHTVLSSNVTQNKGTIYRNPSSLGLEKSGAGGYAYVVNL